MIRDQFADQNYFDDAYFRNKKYNQYGLENIYKESKNPIYAPQYWHDFSLDCIRFLIVKYSRGNKLDTFRQDLINAMNAWEYSNQLSEKICATEKLTSCRSWKFKLNNLDHYVWCFWHVSLAICLKLEESYWEKLLLLIGEQETDFLLDTLIASRSPSWKVGKILLHPKPYSKLKACLEVEGESQKKLFFEFVDDWFKQLSKSGKAQPFWCDFGDPIKNPLSMGSYFGRWCFEAAAFAKVFHLNDSLCIDHPHYPSDIIEDQHSDHSADDWEPQVKLVSHQKEASFKESVKKWWPF